MNTSVETIDDFVATVKAIASAVRKRVGYKWDSLVEDHGTFLLIRFPGRDSIHIPSNWVVLYNHGSELRRKVEKRVETALRHGPCS